VPLGRKAAGIISLNIATDRLIVCDDNEEPSPHPSNNVLCGSNARGGVHGIKIENPATGQLHRHDSDVLLKNDLIMAGYVRDSCNCSTPGDLKTLGEPSRSKLFSLTSILSTEIIHQITLGQFDLI
jgi:hypothetical protein